MPRSPAVVVTDVDHVAHHVTRVMYDRCQGNGDRVFFTVCGRWITAAALATAPTGNCQICPLDEPLIELSSLAALLAELDRFSSPPAVLAPSVRGCVTSRPSRRTG